MRDVSVCFLGCGRINARHIQTLKRLRPQTRIAVASRDTRRARAFAARHGARDSYGSYEDAIASDYETIVIGVPPSAHRSLVELALAAGKHLLIEKPVFASFDELEALWPRLPPPRDGDGGGEPSLRAVSPPAQARCWGRRGWGSR